KEEEDAARALDCIKRFREQVLREGSVLEGELEAIDEANEEKIGFAVKFAEQSPLPDAAELYTDVFVTDSQ
ncbi:MAG: pyruvate dehydrogenase (acetyl-transferring) E1 component subunit alpha, partial [Acidobacteriota bacterium]|nr:pyruvate dehydrogenase (acetyl-transferring) E1 component subunit alpha [Acidobacteriota bacterium]